MKHTFKLIKPEDPIEPVRYFYGYSDSVFSDECEPVLTRYVVTKETPKGVWLRNDHFYGEIFWVSTTGRKRKAYPTRKEALHGYLCRKKRQVEILSARLRLAQKRLAAVQKIVTVPTEAKGQVSSWR